VWLMGVRRWTFARWIMTFSFSLSSFGLLREIPICHVLRLMYCCEKIELFIIIEFSSRTPLAAVFHYQIEAEKVLEGLIFAFRHVIISGLPLSLSLSLWKTYSLWETFVYDSICLLPRDSRHS